MEASTFAYVLIFWMLVQGEEPHLYFDSKLYHEAAACDAEIPILRKELVLEGIRGVVACAMIPKPGEDT